MEDWVAKLDAFLRFNEYEGLDNPGRVSAQVAKELASKEYSKFRVQQDREWRSDFDALVDEAQRLDLPEE